MAREFDEKVDPSVLDLVPDYESDGDMPGLVDADAPPQARPPHAAAIAVNDERQRMIRVIAASVQRQRFFAEVNAIVEKAERKFIPQGDPVLRAQMAKVVVAMSADRGERVRVVAAGRVAANKSSNKNVQKSLHSSCLSSFLSRRSFFPSFTAFTFGSSSGRIGATLMMRRFETVSPLFSTTFPPSIFSMTS